MITDLLLIIMFVALALYVLLGGADYGGGIVSLFERSNDPLRDKERHLIQKAMGPVWEANHMWLIIVVVMLFMGFPEIYTVASTYLHWPLVMILIGIVLRGSAFTFKHYDPEGERFFDHYTRVFAWSSLWTSFWLGITIAALNSGRMGETRPDFYLQYIKPWYHPYGFFMGLFTSSQFAFLASVYLIGESKDEALISHFKKRAHAFLGLMVISGALVFLASWWQGLDLVVRFFTNPACLTMIFLATVLLYPMFASLQKKKIIQARLLAGAIILFIIGGWAAMEFPVVIHLPERVITFYNAQASEATLRQLLAALLVGIVIIFPSLGYLFYTFKMKDSHESEL